MADDDRPEFDESLLPEEDPPTFQDIVIDERHRRYAAQRWPSESLKMQEVRVKQAIWARVRHRQPHPDDPNRRLLGGPQPNSGPKVTKRTGQAIVEEAQKRQKEITDAVFAPLAESNDPMIRHKAAMNIAKHERDERAMDITEDEYARKTTDEIRREAAQMFAQMVRSGELSLEDIVDIPPEDVEEILDESRALSS